MSAAQRSPPSSSEKNRREIRLANEAFYRAFENLDASLMQDIWHKADHIHCIHPGGELLRGYTAVMRSWEEIFSNTLSIRFKLTDIAVHALSSWGWVTLHENVTIHSSNGLTKGVMIATNLFERVGNDWKIIHHHAAPAPLEFIPPQPKTTLH